MGVLEDELGDIVAKARAGQTMSAGTLASRAGISEGDIGLIEAYRLVPDAAVVRALASALGLAPDKLVGISEGSWVPNVLLPQDGHIFVERVSVPFGPYGENCYILGFPETGLAVVIDPGGAADEISELLARHGFDLDAILVTHAHADHIGGIRALAMRRPRARLVSHQLDLNSVAGGLPNDWEPAADGNSLTIGKQTVVPISTPGHTPGSVCYYTDGVCCVGDTLFAGSIGRASGTGAYGHMLSAVESSILSLPADTVLLPGHGPITTVAEERLHNPFFR